MDFKLVSEYKPTGDQPEAIAQLVDALRSGCKHNTLLGVTGSGKTFTMANVIAALIIGLSALVISAAGIGIGRKASSRLGAKAEVFGGLILIAIGTRILLEHLGVIG